MSAGGCYVVEVCAVDGRWSVYARFFTCAAALQAVAYLQSAGMRALVRRDCADAPSFSSV